MYTHELMPILDIRDIYTDAFVLNENGTLAFLSLIGKETAIQEMRARWSLPVSQGGQTDFQVKTSDGVIRLNLGNIEALEFISGRLATHLFGHLIQVFVHHYHTQKPDFVNRKAMQLYEKHRDENIDADLWQLIKTLSPLPLLDVWKKFILGEFENRQWLRRLSGYGKVNAVSIHIPEEELAEMLKVSIRSGDLTV